MVEEKLDGIGLQEAIRQDFTWTELKKLEGGHQFVWIWKESKGHSGGILMGVKEDILEVEGSEVGEFYVSMVLRHRLNNFRWEMLTVYEPTQHSQSMVFITELSRKCTLTSLPMVIGGDFNLIR
jgi:hypothetical protein